MSKKSVFELEAWTFKENLENDSLNIAETALNHLLFRNKEDYTDNNINEQDLAKVKIKIVVEKQ